MRRCSLVESDAERSDRLKRPPAAPTVVVGGNCSSCVAPPGGGREPGLGAGTGLIPGLIPRGGVNPR